MGLRFHGRAGLGQASGDLEDSKEVRKRYPKLEA